MKPWKNIAATLPLAANDANDVKLKCDFVMRCPPHLRTGELYAD